MEGLRQQKVSRLLQKELGEIFQREGRSLFSGAFITVTKVRVSPDLSVAKVYLSFFSVKDTAALMKKITDETKTIRRTLGDKIKNQVRVIPNLTFFIDDSLDYLEKIENLLKQ